MKNPITLILYRLVLAGSLLFSGPSFAAPEMIAKEILGHQFCSVDVPNNLGWSFSENGLASAFSPNAGRPDPSTYFKAVFSFHPAEFEIVQFRSSDNKEIHVVGRFIYDASSRSISSGKFVLSRFACQNSGESSNSWR